MVHHIQVVQVNRFGEITTVLYLRDHCLWESNWDTRLFKIPTPDFFLKVEEQLYYIDHRFLFLVKLTPMSTQSMGHPPDAITISSRMILQQDPG